MKFHQYDPPPCRRSPDSVDSQRCEDPLSLTLGPTGTCVCMRGIGYGAPSNTYYPDSPKLAKKRALEQGLPPLHSHAHGSQSQVDDISVSLVGTLLVYPITRVGS